MIFTPKSDAPFSNMWVGGVYASRVSTTVPSNTTMYDARNISVTVDGGIYASSLNAGYPYRLAHAAGFADDTMGMYVDNFTLNVGQDIAAVAEGSSDTVRYTSDHNPLFAGGVACRLHNITNSHITVQGSIRAENLGSVSSYVDADGIGHWDQFSRENYTEDPVRIEGVHLKVGKDIIARQTKSGNNSDAYAWANGFYQNFFSGTFAKNEQFNGNTVQIAGNIIAESVDAKALAGFSAAFVGNDNTFSVSALKSVSQNQAYSMPFFEYAGGEGNTVKIADGLYADSPQDSIGGWAFYLQQFDGSKNTLEVSKLQATHGKNFGGLACSSKQLMPALGDGYIKNASLHYESFDAGSAQTQLLAGGLMGQNTFPVSDSSVKLDEMKSGSSSDSAAYIGGLLGWNSGVITNTTVVIPKFTSNNAKAKTRFVGGFIGSNNADISSGRTDIGEMNVTSSGQIGGFIGSNGQGTLTTCRANLLSMNIIGIDADGTALNPNVGGFAGKFTGSAKDSASFVRDGIEINSPAYANVGGFAGLIQAGEITNSSAQVGEDVIVSNASGAVHLGGFAGRMQNTADQKNLVSSSTALVFGDLKAETSAANAPSLTGGFAGYLMGARGSNLDKTQFVVSDSANYVGGEIVSGNLEPLKAYNSNIPDTGSAFGMIYNASVMGHTVLAQKEHESSAHHARPDAYFIVAMGDTPNEDGSALLNMTIADPYYVQVDNDMRCAFEIEIARDGTTSVGDEEIGSISVAPRTFQDNYWGPNAEDGFSGFPINDVGYVLDDSSQATLKRVSPDAGLLARNNERVTVPDFSTRHLALSAVGESSGPTYDIWGIPAYKTVTLSYVTNSDECSYEDETYDFGTEVSLDKTPVRTGYTFVGWYLDEALSTPAPDVLAMKADTTVYAKWDINSYTLRFDTDGGTPVAEQTYTYGSQTDITGVQTTKDGFTFVRWEREMDGERVAYEPFEMTTDETLYAKWQKVVEPKAFVMLSFETNGGSLMPAQRYESGTMVSKVNSPTRTGYTFEGWYRDAQLQTPFTPFIITRDTTLYAKWKLIEEPEQTYYTLTYESNGGTTFASERILSGTQVVIDKAPVREGYVFKGWYFDKDFTHPYAQAFEMTSDVTMYAKWEPKEEESRDEEQQDTGTGEIDKTQTNENTSHTVDNSNETVNTSDTLALEAVGGVALISALIASGVYRMRRTAKK